MADVKTLCQNNSDLDDIEVNAVEQLSYYLQYVADLTRADIFIDIKTTDQKEALVVAEANPATATSLYTQSVVGAPAYQKNEPAVFKAFKTGRPVWEVKGVSQEGTPIKQSVIPIKSSNDRVIATLIMEQDITEQIKTAAKVELLSETTEKLTSALLDVATVDEVLPTILQDAVIITNGDYTVLYANPLAQQLLQTSGEPERGSNLIDSIRELIGNTAEHKDVPTGNEIIIDHRIFVIKHVPIKKKNRLASHIILLRDVTELRNKEKELMVKSAVIKEIHHRVKNNLHTVASLLRLQMRRSDFDEVKKALISSINRISSIALIHEALAFEDIHLIDLKPLIEKVASLSIQSNVESGDKLSFNITGSSVRLPSEIATGTAMVLNELIQNSIEHGFSPEGAGKIDIDIQQVANQIIINFYDNGCGLPADFTISGSAGLGLNIVDSIVREKLGGTIQFNSNSGTFVKICFPVPDKGGYLCTA